MEENRLFDTSVIIAGYVEDHVEARNLLEQNGQRYILDLTLIEVTDVLRYKKAPMELARTMLNSLDSSLFNLVETNKFNLVNAFEISEKFDVSVYDALYVAVALKFNYKFYTLDKKLERSVRSLGCAELLT